MIIKRHRIVLYVFIYLSYGCVLKQKMAADKGGSVGNKTQSISVDSSNAKSYAELINNTVRTQSGLLKVHQAGSRLYFELPDSILNQDLLIVNRISKAAIEKRPERRLLGYAGDYIGDNIVQFSIGPNRKVFMKRIVYSEMRSTDSSENGMYHSVQNSTVQPLVASFPIKAFSPDSGVVIDATEYVNGDNEFLFFSSSIKKVFGLGAVQPDRSFLKSITSYPTNIEITTVKTYSNADGNAEASPYRTYELNSSIILLPQKSMPSRTSDRRIGYFSRAYLDLDATHPEGITSTKMITRWRLEPKPAEVETYLSGKLVEPLKPIIFYIDPATPQKWVPYLMQGVKDWQQAFEKAGFKNAIYALEAPVNDPNWSLYDARHSAIVYKPSVISNASGPHIHDPRTGEILESHINWYHNITELLRNWYFVQASAIDPNARQMIFNDSLMGQLIRFVCAHEVGHTLGLTHNFGSSSTIPVEQLRNKTWVEENGFCPSIMDYARFNYVAQPEDNITAKGIFPRIGVYDEWAIEWGYRWFRSFKDKKEEKEFMNNWIVQRLKKDSRLYFGDQGSNDPRNQAEDLGDDAIKASTYGIKNLKRIIPDLRKWTAVPYEGYKSLDNIHKEVIEQFKKYLFHVSAYVGGIKNTYRTIEQNGPVVEFVSREQQKRAVAFFQKELFQPPLWLFDPSLFPLVGNEGLYRIENMQMALLDKIVSQDVFQALLVFETNPQQGETPYTINELLNDLEASIWSELDAKKPINIYRRNLQKLYLTRLLSISDNVSDNKDIYFSRFYASTDVPSIIRYHLTKVLEKTKRLQTCTKDTATLMHLADLQDRLQKHFANKSRPSGAASNNSIQEENLFSEKDMVPTNPAKPVLQLHYHCWLH